MISRFLFTISLRTKFIVFIGAIISFFYLFMLYRTSQFDEQMIQKQAEQQARMLYKQILLTRQWASDHNGLFILKRKGVEPNPYLELPTVSDASGNTYYMRNPAMITRELSVYARRDGLGHFRVTSLKPVNPNNKPDSFEQRSLFAFQHGVPETIDIERTEEGRFVRFMAPLQIIDSCLSCHAQHGYKLGDIRGGLSITIPINWVDELVSSNVHDLLMIGVASIVCVTIVLSLMFETLIFHRISRLNRAMDIFPERPEQPQLALPRFSDELDSVEENFSDFCDRLERSQEELLKTRQQAHLNEKMASLGILTAGIAHEVNNPLGGMLNCVKSMRDNPEDTAKVQRYLPLLDKGLRQIELIMRQLLNFGRTDPLKVRRVDPRQIFDECIALMSYKLKNIELQSRMQIEGEYLLDAEALKQIIVNIGLNAIQAMPDGGKLTMECRKRTEISEKGELQEFLILSFADTGCGIPPENRPHIFDPFFTTKDVGEGTGLGLAVTFSLVQRMGGTIQVDSTEGVGTLFTITIPTGNHSAEKESRAAEEKEQQYNEKHNEAHL